MTDHVAAGGFSPDLESTLRLLNDLVDEVRRLDTTQVSPDRLQEIVTALAGRPNIETLPQTFLRVYSEIMEALHGIRLSRETIQSYSIDRIHDTQAKLDEVSSATESAALEMLNGLDRTLAMIDQLEAGSGGADGKATFNAVRAEVNQLYGCLQFQDITAQQLAGVASLLGEIEQRMQLVANIFDNGRGARQLEAATERDVSSFNADASTRDVAERQAVIDQAFTDARTRERRPTRSERAIA